LTVAGTRSAWARCRPAPSFSHSEDALPAIPSETEWVTHKPIAEAKPCEPDDARPGSVFQGFSHRRAEPVHPRSRTSDILALRSGASAPWADVWAIRSSASPAKSGISRGRAALSSPRRDAAPGLKIRSRLAIGLGCLWRRLCRAVNRPRTPAPSCTWPARFRGGCVAG
jgi:hypothetical protein